MKGKTDYAILSMSDAEQLLGFVTAIFYKRYSNASRHSHRMPRLPGVLNVQRALSRRRVGA